MEVELLLNRGYPLGEAVGFCGLQHGLSGQQMAALERACLPDAEARRNGFLAPDQLRGGRPSYRDAMDQLFTVQLSMLFLPLTRCADGILRLLDRSWRPSDTTDQAIALAIETLRKLEPQEVAFWIGRNTPGAIELEEHILNTPAELAYDLTVQRVTSPEASLKKRHPVSSADGRILSSSSGWFALVALARLAEFPAQIVDISPQARSLSGT